jgi:hypothetical protein
MDPAVDPAAAAVEVEIGAEAEAAVRKEKELVQPVAMAGTIPTLVTIAVSCAIGPGIVTTNSPRKKSRHTQPKRRSLFSSQRLWSPVAAMTQLVSPSSVGGRLKGDILSWRGAWIPLMHVSL